MTEQELLNNIAKTCIEIDTQERLYRRAAQVHAKEYPRWDDKRLPEAREKWKAVAEPIRDKKTDLKRRLTGYLFMYETKQWVKT